MVLAFLTVAIAVPGPISSATVFSGQARVVRTAQVQLRDLEMVEWPLLPPGADPASVRLEAVGGGAEIAHVTLRPLTAAELPAGRAADGAERLAELDEKIAARAREQALHERLAGVTGWKPELPEDSAPVRLDPRGWRRGLAFLESFAGRMHERARAAQSELEQLRGRRERRARDDRDRSGAPAAWQVSSVVTGSGPAEVRLSYLVTGARWIPQYEVRLHGSQDRVTVALSGVVTQQTGEDWTDAALTLSTATPSAFTRLPRLPAWRIGERDRFVPAPRREQQRPPPPTTQLRAGPGTLVAHVFDQSGIPLKGVKVAINPSLARACYTDDEGRCVFTSLLPGSYQLTASAPKLLTVIMEVLVGEQGGEAAMVMEISGQVEEVRVAERAPMVSTNTPYVRETLDLGVPSAGGSRREPPRPFWPASPGLSRPRPAAGTAALLSGGHEIEFAAAAPETIASGDQRTVPLQSWTWPVAVERALYPGLDADGYLQARLHGPGERPLPGGRASIVVGDDPVGAAELRPVAPGQSFTLPLGVDRAIRAIRRATVQTRPAGLFRRDEIDRHLVTIEITNPHATPARLQVHDQIPVSGDPRVQVTLGEASVGATFDRETGALRWPLELAPGASTTVAFRYEIRRPRGQRLEGAP
jgi:hypothetical protein